MYTSFAKAFGWTFQQIDDTDLEDLFDIIIVQDLTKDEQEAAGSDDILAGCDDEDAVFNMLTRIGR